MMIKHKIKNKINNKKINKKIILMILQTKNFKNIVIKKNQIFKTLIKKNLNN